MSLDLYLHAVRNTCVYDTNVTHNVTCMARAAGIYDALWHPKESGYTTANKLVPVLEDALRLMREDPERFRKLEAPNGWGTLDQFIPWVEQLLEACRENPDASVEVSI